MKTTKDKQGINSQTDKDLVNNPGYSFTTNDVGLWLASVGL